MSIAHQGRKFKLFINLFKGQQSPSFEKLMKMDASDFVSFRVKKHDSNPKYMLKLCFAWVSFMIIYVYLYVP